MEIQSGLQEEEPKRDEARPKEEPKMDETRLKLAETSFKTVLEADVHQDNKANRILAAMAFLTAATAAIFNKAYSATTPTAEASTSQQPQLILWDLNISLVAFTAYMFFVLLGAALYLIALGGGALNLPARFGSGSGSGSTVKSLLFFEKIGALNEDTWKGHWSTSTSIETLQTQMFDNYIFETRLIAEKVRAKVFWMYVGTTLFKAALLSLIILIASLFASNEYSFWFYSLLATCGFFGVLMLEAWKRPGEITLWRWIQRISWSLISVAALVGLLLIIFGVITLSISK